MQEFNNEQELKILEAAGYTGSSQKDEMEAYKQSNPAAESLVLKLERKAKQMQGMPTKEPAGMAVGGVTKASGVTVAKPKMAMLKPDATQTIAQPKAQSATTATAAQAGTAAQTTSPTTPLTSQMQAGTTQKQVGQQLGTLQAQQGQVTQQAQVSAAQQNQSAVSGLQAAQGAATMMQNPVQRQIQSGELISGAADAAKAAQFTEQIQAAQATPSKQATVQGQLDGLMTDFDGGKTPAWAAGAMRAATSAMAARGLGASSLAGQAVVQAAMESALPIAQADASTQAQFESQNLSNRQQRAMLAAQQRAEFMGQEFDQQFQSRVANASKVSDIANMNFTAEQQVALENSRASNTMNLANLSNDQAVVMAEAAALSQLDMANLNNRQQASVQNAQAFLNMEMTNLNNEQQVAMFKSQQNIQSILTDQAAENAAAQFNSASENQTNQFFADLQTNVAKFNTDQTNAMKQFDTNAVNATRQFNVAQDNAFKQFMVTNSLVVAQANAKWRQTAATLNQATANEEAMYVAKEQNALSQAELDEIWQRERDEMDYVFNSYQNDQDRSSAIVLAKLAADASLDAAKLQGEIGANQEIGGAFFKWLFDKL